MQLRHFNSVFIIILIVFTIFGFAPIIKTHASSPDSILVDIVPQNPAPKENTTITLNSYTDDLNHVSITWLVNGKNSLSGIGKKTFLLTAPDAGVETNITAVIKLSDGIINKTIKIKPNVMALLWQANDSYVPPFYKGKALPSPGSSIKVIAMPEIKNGSSLLDPLNMVYSWKLNYNNDQENSGYGKNSFVFMNDYLENASSVDVSVNTVDQKYSTEGNININTTNPKIVFYKSDARVGTIWEKALGDGHTVLGDETIEATPYFISPKDIRIPLLTWSWSINGNPVDVLGIKKNFLPVKAQAGTSGTSKIGLEINNIDKIFETASGEINVQF